MPTIEQAVEACRSVEMQERLHAKRREQIVAMWNRALWWLVAFGVILIAAACGTLCERNAMQRQAIQHGAARYNPQTAAFEWIDLTD